MCPKCLEFALNDEGVSDFVRGLVLASQVETAAARIDAINRKLRRFTNENR